MPFLPLKLFLVSFKLAMSETNIRDKLLQGAQTELQETKWDLSWLVLALFATVSLYVSVSPINYSADTSDVETINGIESTSD